MFESVMQNNQQNMIRYFASLLLSHFTRVLVLCVIAAVPLVFCTTLHTEELLTIVPVPPPLPPQPNMLIQVSSTMQESKVLLKVSPAYPEIARSAHISGKVILSAIIDEEGMVSSLKVLSGHPFLRDAAYQAVKQWKYSPTLMNGQPVSTQAPVTVIFILH